VLSAKAELDGGFRVSSILVSVAWEQTPTKQFFLITKELTNTAPFPHDMAVNTFRVP